MSVNTIQLKEGQHVVTYVPKVTTDLPFFVLTHSKKNLPDEVDFEGIDKNGNPIKYKAFYNVGKSIGHPATEAHKLWMLLIKPEIDFYKNKNGKIPSIIPLGNVRECLRKIGVITAGGFQARRLFKNLRQIAYTGIEIDIFIATGEKNSEGKNLYKQLTGNFTKMTIFKIGEKHLTEEEVKNADFDFDLDDTIYIQLHQLEKQLLHHLDNDQKIIDNEYMFSVNASARRWYELMATKVFGATKHEGYFKIRYSDYVKHHHTLKKQHERRRVVQQMNGVVKDHLATGFLKGVEYKKIKEKNKELDFEIIYKVGVEAKESIKRIKKYTRPGNRKKQDEDNKAQNSPQMLPNLETDTFIAEETKNVSTPQKFNPQGILKKREVVEMLDTVTIEQREMFKTLLIEHNVKRWKVAYELATEKLEICKKQIKALPFRKTDKNPTGLLIRSIEQDWTLPNEMIEAEKTEIKRKEREVQEQKKHLENQEKQKIIDACSICNEKGIFYVPSLFKMSNNISITRARHNCSHIEETEKHIEQYDEDLHSVPTPELVKRLEQETD